MYHQQIEDFVIQEEENIVTEQFVFNVFIHSIATILGHRSEETQLKESIQVFRF